MAEEKPAPPAPAKPVGPRASPRADLGMVTLGPLLVWIWGMIMPEYPMTAEVAVAAAGVIGIVARYLCAFLPEAKKGATQ